MGLQAPFYVGKSPGGPERLAVTLPPWAGCPRRGRGSRGRDTGEADVLGKARAVQRFHPLWALLPPRVRLGSLGKTSPGRVSSCLWGPCGAPCRGLSGACVDGAREACTDTRAGGRPSRGNWGVHNCRTWGP